MHLLKKLYKKLPLNIRRSTLVFVHIPKTAGTSFRRAALNYFGPNKTHFDYGMDSPETSRLVLENVYLYPDLFLFRKRLLQARGAFLGGHFKALKYASLFSCMNFVTFVRHPVERVISHYNHAVDIQECQEDLMTFCKRRPNVQSIYVHGFPLELFGFLGVTEEYGKGIELINSIHKLPLEYLQHNVSEKSSKRRNALSDAEFDYVASLNHEDMKMYSRALTIFNERKKMFSQNQPYTFCCVETLNNKMVAGWAFCPQSSQKVRIEIYRNQTLEVITSAVEPRDNLIRFCPERNGFVGFRHSFEKPLTKDDKVLCRVYGTKQVLTGPDRIPQKQSKKDV